MPHATAAGIYKSSELTGFKIVDPDGEKLGELRELMIDTAFGRVAYAVLQFGGFLGIGDKYFAIPWEALMLNMDDRAFVLDVDRKMLKEEDGFDEDHWPDMADYKWGSDVYSKYGYHPYWE